MIKYFRHIAMILVGILSSLPTFSYDFEVDGLCYNKLSDNEVEVTYKNADGDSYSGNLTIPSSVTYNGSKYTVTAIGSRAFYNCSKLTGSLTIPSTITSIGEYSFYSCDGLSGSLAIPNSVKSIGQYAFCNCRGFTNSLTIPSSINKIEGHVFYGCSGFTGSLIIPNSILSIGVNAFAYCGGLNGPLTIPSSVTSIESGAFNYCKHLRMVESWIESPFSIPKDVFKDLASDAVLQVPKGSKSKYELFSGWAKNFSRIVEEGEIFNQDEIIYGIEINGLYYDLNKTEKTATVTYKYLEGDSYSGSLSIPSSVIYNGSTYSVTTIGSRAFFGCSRLTGSLSIPNSVKKIEDFAFYYCYRLTGSLIIPNSVLSIGYFAFAYCSGFTGSLTIPSSVMSIEGGAFYNISSNKLIISSSVTNIGSGAFERCHHLNIVESWIESPFYIENDAFLEIMSNAALQVPKSTKNKYESYSGWTKNFSKIVEEGESINLDEVLNGIEINGLYYNLNITKKTATLTYKNYSGNSYSGILSIPSSVIYNGSTYSLTAIGPHAFLGCSNLTGSLIIPGSVTSIGKNAFWGCSGLTGSLIIPNSVKTIDQGAFGNCRGFTGSLIIPNSITSIEPNAFYNCNGFTGSLTIPNSVTSIGEHAFTYCDGFTGSLTIPNSVTSIGESAFFNCIGFTGSLTIPNSVISIGSYAFYNCRRITGSLIIPNSVTSIEYSAFENCSGINGTLIIPSSVRSIGSFAFKKCNRLNMVESAIDSPFYITEDVFQDIASNAVLQVPKGTKSKYEAYTGWTKNFSKIVETEGTTTTYELSITASGNGSVSYAGTTIRSKTITFTVNEGASATISFNPDNGYKINSVKVNSSNVTSNLSNNKYTISNINKNTTVEVEFQEEIKTFTINSVNYTIISYDNKTINLANGNYGIVLEVPATITYQGVTWSVAGIDNNALANNDDLAAIIWDPSVAFTGSVNNPNLLLYVKSASYAPATIKNVVVNSTAESIVLTDAASGNDFYCPKEFTARKISYTHNYGMITGIDECRGWETIALPFDVKKIAHSSKGELTPFANWRSGDNKKPFWLMSYGAGGWTNASSIKANTPYIISMPNNPDYKAEFRLSGNITFSAENVTVKKSDDLQTGNYGGNTFTPNFSNKNNSGYLTLNVNNDYASYTGASAEGSIFIANLRTVHPFEAYMTSSSKSRSTISINGDMTTGIEDMAVLMDESKGLRIYNLKGQLIKVEQDKGIDDVKNSLPAGVYIVNGKKLIIK